MDALEETCDNLPGDYADRCKGKLLRIGPYDLNYEIFSHH